MENSRRGSEKRSDRHRSRSRERGDRKRSDRKRSRSNDRGERRGDRQEKKSSRARSRTRSRSRDRSGASKSHRDKDREKDKDKDKDRERDKIRDAERKSTTVPDMKPNVAEPVVKTAAELESDRVAQKEEEQAILEDEMRKRRERVKAWQDEKARRIAAEAAVQGPATSPTILLSPNVQNGEVDINGVEGDNSAESIEMGSHIDTTADSSGTGAWTLEDDDDDLKNGEGAKDEDEADIALPSILNLAGTQPQSEEAWSKSASISHVKSKKERSASISIGVIGSPKKSTNDLSKSECKEEIRFAPSEQLVVSAPHAIAEAVKIEYTNNVFSAQPIVPLTSMPSAVPDDGVDKHLHDPLDDFMSSLYEEGDVETQVALSDDAPSEDKDQTKGRERRGTGTAPTASSSSSSSSSSGANGSVSNLNDEPQGDAALKNDPQVSVKDDGVMVVDESGDDEYDEYSYLAGDNPKVNPFGSNFITLDQIMGGKVHSNSPVRSSSDSGNVASGDKATGHDRRMDYSNSGWESDSAPPSPMYGSTDKGDTTRVRSGETEDEREEREDRERKEFIDAIRAARAAEDVVRERTRQKDDAAEKSKEQLGRVFAGEGDVMDEKDVEEKKKSALEILEDSKKGKELKPVDHKSVEYIPFRKNLYIVPRVLSKLTEENLVEKRDDLQIKVRGKGCPAPVDTWGQCGLSERVLGVIEKLGLEAPFAIQKQAIPAIMCGRDLIGVAKTGSGKTLAFLLPMFRHILDQPPLRDSEGPIGLVMAPARELAFQIFNEAKKFSKALGIRVACVYGGTGVADQIADLKRGAEIVVCTPGRMIDILCMQAGKLVNLRRVTMVVLDEADRCFDMGFAPQIEMVLQNIRPDRQTVLFSATFPKQIEKLAKTVLRLPLEVVVGERSSVNKDITQVVEVHEDSDKFMRLLQLLGVWYEKGSVLVFVDTQEKCDQLFHDLLKSGYPCLSLHGGKDQLDRDHTLHEFKKGIKTVMVATSVAGRGLDVPDIVVVVNYNCPNHIEDYVHRVGRTGRAGRKGTAYTFISPSEEQYSPLMIKALEKASQAPAQELLDMVASFKEKVGRGEARYSSSGFDGKGFTFDASEQSETQKNASLQRKAYDIEQGIDEKGEEEEEDEEGEKEKDKDKDKVPGGLPLLAAPVVESTPLERARAIATSLCLSKGLPVPIIVTLPASLNSVPSVAASIGADGKIDSRAAMLRAKAIASQLASGGKLGEGPEVKEAAAHFSEELDINDYPPQARRKVTHKNALDDISEQTGVAIISRGSYVPPGKKLEVGERRLFLLIEGSTDLQVRQAKLEILRMLDEETLRIGASGNASSFGRYAVL